MKRSKPLKRTPFRKALAGTSAVKRRNANLRRMSAKKRKYDRVWKPIHDAWLAQWTHCWHCKQRKPLTIQHISKRSHGGDYHDLANLYVACRECNCGPLDSSSKESQAAQLATKKLLDPVNYSLAKWNLIHGSNRISEEDVATAMRKEMLT